MKFESANIKIYLFLLLICLSGLTGYTSPLSKDSIGYTSRISAGLNVSTMGLGLTVTKSITKRFDVRLNGSYSGYTYDINKLSSDLQGDARLVLGSAGTFLDYYIFRFFYLSGGASYNLTKVTIQGQLSDSINIGDILLEPKDIGNLNVAITPGWKVNPYLGLGFNFRRKRNFNIGLEFGVFFQGPPAVTLQATGMLTPTGSKEQELLMEQNIAPLIYYPYISLRFSHHIKLRR